MAASVKSPFSAAAAAACRISLYSYQKDLKPVQLELFIFS